MKTLFQRFLLCASFFVSVALAHALTTQTISFPTIPMQHYGASYTLMATASSGLPVTFTVTSAYATIPVGGNVGTFTGGGWITIQAAQGGNASYSPVSTSQTFSVDKGLQAVTFINPGVQVLEAGGARGTCNLA